MKKGLLLIVSSLVLLAAIGCGSAEPQASTTEHDTKGNAVVNPKTAAGGAGGGAAKSPPPASGPQ